MIPAGRTLLVGRALLVGVLLLVGGAHSGAQDRPSPTRTESAPGVHLFRTAPYGDLGLDGNAVAIIGSSGVLVFDTNGTPSAAAVTPAPPDLPHLKKALVAIAPIPPK